MRLTDHVHTVRRVLWWATGICWGCAILAALVVAAAGVNVAPHVELLVALVLLCLSKAALEISCLPDTQAIVAGAWVAGYRAAESQRELRSVQ